MIPFKSPVDDILFSLHHVAGADRLGSWDADTAGDILKHFSQLAEDVIAPLNALGDTEGARFENGRVRMPEGFAEAYAQLADGGWQGLTAPEESGGMGLPPTVAVGVSEVFSGANHSMQMVCNLVPGAIATLCRYGSAAQQAAWIPKLASGEALSTMCLTEPAAGSDLSAIRTKAVQTDQTWHITGEKIFISGGDQDLSDDILHLVLARTSDDGLKGLSLFLCPKQPGAKVTRIEEKLGLHASPTCQMVFEEAEAELVGPEGGGLKAMFTLMNHARLDVALQGVAHAARAAQIATHYVQERKQGKDAHGAPLQLIDHADVRRMLDRQQILALGARAMCHLAMVEMELGNRPGLADFLTPICKVFGSEAGIEAADLGIQMLGGYGYLDEYGMHQIWRDARICAIYEGANGIHTRSLITRGLRPNGGADTFAELVAELGGQRQVVQTALSQWQGFRQWVTQLDDPTPQAHDFYTATADLLLTAVWAKIGDVADLHRDAAALRRLSEIALKKNGARA